MTPLPTQKDEDDSKERPPIIPTENNDDDDDFDDWLIKYCLDQFQRFQLYCSLVHLFICFWSSFYKFFAQYYHTVSKPLTAFPHNPRRNHGQL